MFYLKTAFLRHVSAVRVCCGVVAEAVESQDYAVFMLLDPAKAQRCSSVSPWCLYSQTELELQTNPAGSSWTPSEKKRGEKTSEGRGDALKARGV